MDIWVDTTPDNMDETIQEYTSKGWSYEGSNGRNQILLRNNDINAEDFGLDDDYTQEQLEMASAHFCGRDL